VREVLNPGWSLGWATQNGGTHNTACDVCDEGSETDSEGAGPLWEGNTLRLVCEENFGDDKCRINSWAEKEDEEKIKHRHLPFKKNESSIKSAEGYNDI
jgi:hypothetical protein